MITRRSALLTLALATLASEARPLWAASRRPSAIKMFDTDNDGTLDLEEVKKAASRLFATLDLDHVGTFDRREVGGGLPARNLPRPIPTGTVRLRWTNICPLSSDASTRPTRTEMEPWTPKNSIAAPGWLYCGYCSDGFAHTV